MKKFSELDTKRKIQEVQEELSKLVNVVVSEEKPVIEGVSEEAISLIKKDAPLIIEPDCTCGMCLKGDNAIYPDSFNVLINLARENASKKEY